MPDIDMRIMLASSRGEAKENHGEKEVTLFLQVLEPADVGTSHYTGTRVVQSPRVSVCWRESKAITIFIQTCIAANQVASWDGQRCVTLSRIPRGDWSAWQWRDLRNPETCWGEFSNQGTALG